MRLLERAAQSLDRDVGVPLRGRQIRVTEQSTFTTVYQIFDEAFVLYNFGKASAISMTLFAITLVLSLASIRIMGDDDGR